MLHDPAVSPVSIHRVEPKYTYGLEYVTRNPSGGRLLRPINVRHGPATNDGISNGRGACASLLRLWGQQLRTVGHTWSNVCNFHAPIRPIFHYLLLRRFSVGWFLAARISAVRFRASLNIQKNPR